MRFYGSSYKEEDFYRGWRTILYIVSALCLLGLWKVFDLAIWLIV